MSAIKAGWRPTIYVHEDGLFVSVSPDEGMPDTLLKIGGQDGSPGAGDVARVHVWAKMINELIDEKFGTKCQA